MKKYICLDVICFILICIVVLMFLRFLLFLLLMFVTCLFDLSCYGSYSRCAMFCFLLFWLVVFCFLLFFQVMLFCPSLSCLVHSINHVLFPVLLTGQVALLHFALTNHVMFSVISEVMMCSLFERSYFIF